MIPQLGDIIKSNRRGGSADSIIPWGATGKCEYWGLCFTADASRVYAVRRPAHMTFPILFILEEKHPAFDRNYLANDKLSRSTPTINGELLLARRAVIDSLFGRFVNLFGGHQDSRPSLDRSTGVDR